MVAIGVEVLGPRERPNEKPGVLTARRSPPRPMPRCPAQPGSMSQTLRLYHQGSKIGATAVPWAQSSPAGKRYIRSRLRALKIRGSVR